RSHNERYHWASSHPSKQRATRRPLPRRRQHMGTTLRHMHHRGRGSQSRRHGLALRHIHTNTRRHMRPEMTNIKFDKHDELPTRLTKITITTGHDILISPYPRFGTSNYFTVRISIEEYNRHQRMQAVILRHRYWHDHQGQPRRNPTMRPLLQNGKKPR